MSVLLRDQLQVLQVIAEQPRQHFEISRLERSGLGRLWQEQFVRLRTGDVWEITERGLAILERGLHLH